MQGVLHTYWHAVVRSMTEFTNSNPTMPNIRDSINAARLMHNTTQFHTWANTNRTAIAALAPLAYTDVRGTETFARDLVLLTYYNVIGNRHTSGRDQFRPNANITRTEAVEMMFRLGELQSRNPGTPMYDRLRGVYEGNVPAGTLEAWMGVGMMYANQNTPAAQVREVTHGNLTRQEAALIIADHLVRIDAIHSLGQPTTAFSTAGFANTVNARFTDLNVGPYESETSVLNRPAEVMGTVPLPPRDAYNILRLVDLGIIQTTGNTFNPQGTVTRAEFIQMLVRAFEVQARDIQ